MALKIKIDNFEGPFDLLLHLIKKNELDIYNISISQITNQYLQYINSLKEMDLEITSEFIVIAATLLQIKSRELLPKAKEDESAVTPEEQDPEKILIEKLIEYKKYKGAAAFLKSKAGMEHIMFTKKPEVIVEDKKDIKMEEVFKNITILDLFNIYNEIMRTYKNKMNTNAISGEIPIDQYKIEDKMIYIKQRIKKSKSISFSKLAKECSAKIEVIVTFLGMLELIKLRVIRVTQEENFKEIFLERVDLNEKTKYESN